MKKIVAFFGILLVMALVISGASYMPPGEHQNSDIVFCLDNDAETCIISMSENNTFESYSFLRHDPGDTQSIVMTYGVFENLNNNYFLAFRNRLITNNKLVSYPENNTDNLINEGLYRLDIGECLFITFKESLRFDFSLTKISFSF